VDVSGLRLRSDLRADPDRVWRALVEPAELERWRAPRVEASADAVVCWWEDEPETAYRVVARVEGRSIELHDVARGLFTRVSVAADGDGSVVTVDLGGPAEALLDEYAGSWEALLVTLAHAVERHPDATCDWAVATALVDASLDDTWRRALATLKCVEPVEGVDVGDPVTVRPSSGEPWSGLVLRVEPPRHLAMTLDALDDALLHLHVLPGPEVTTVAVEVLLYDHDEAGWERVQARLERWMAELDRP
jgi:uncharacterized protein YndB with AHSA1/START domain